MSAPKLKVLPDLRDEKGVHRLSTQKWDHQHKKYVRVGVPITEDELKRQLRQPVRLSYEPKYWLYRNRFVLQEGITSEPDEIVSLLQALLTDPSLPTKDAKAKVFAEKVPLWGWNLDGELVTASEMIQDAMSGLRPHRHSELVEHCPNELVLRVKHAVLTEEKALDKLRREVEAFENFEASAGTPREPIPQLVQMFVWKRDGGRCVKCGCQERLEYDHIIPLAKGGSNTERNIQLLCETCNRSKHANIGI